MTMIFTNDGIHTEAFDAIGRYLEQLAPQSKHLSIGDTDRAIESTDETKKASSKGGTTLQKSSLQLSSLL